jgi:hypothetical protein
VRSLRQQLTSDIGIRPEFDHELLSTYCKNQLSIVPLAFLLAVAVAGSAATFVAPDQCHLMAFCGVSGQLRPDPDLQAL